MVGVSIELSGGLEALFGGAKRFAVTVPPPPTAAAAAAAAHHPPPPVTMRHALAWVRDHLLQERPELFMAGDSVRPGILVLVNDADWELEGALAYELQDGDAVAFISTLHGG